MTSAEPLPRSFGWLYPLAFLGAHLAFMPLLVLLLPRRVEAIVGGDPLEALSWLLLIGAATASVAHIAAGALSDRWLARQGSRRGPVAIGTAALAGSYMALAFADTLALLATAFVFFQIALNLAFAPLGALLADYVPDARKGLMAGKLNLALPISTGGVAIVGMTFIRDGVWGMLIVGLLSCLAIVPLVLAWPSGAALQHSPPSSAGSEKRGAFSDFAFAWAARFLVQTGAAFMTSYLYIYLVAMLEGGAALPRSSPSAAVALLSIVAACVSVVAVMAGGAASDRLATRKLPLFVFAVLIAASQLALASAPPWGGIIACYAIFAASQAAFLSLDTALVAQLVAGNPRRGALLGIMNLTNTLPGLTVPLLALMANAAMPPDKVLSFLLLVTGIAALGAGIAITRIRSIF